MMPKQSNKSFKHKILVDGKTLNDIAKESGLRLATVQHRWTRGDRSYEELTRPLNKKNPIYEYNRITNPSYIMGSGDRLMKKILEKNVEITQLSKQTDIARSTIYSFVYYNRDISSGRLAKICKCLSISTDYVLGIKDE